MIVSSLRSVQPYALRGIWSDYGPSSACSENFWSAACWFGQKGSQAVGFENPAGTIIPPPPPVSKCPGTVNADGSCVLVPTVNDPNNTQAVFSVPNIQEEFSDWAAAASASAYVPDNNTAGTGYLWIAGAVLAGVVVLSTVAKR